MTLKHLIGCAALLLAVAAGAAEASFAAFETRAQAGEDLSVVFFGGSLTYSANASDPNVTGVRGLMADYLRARYPRARFVFHDAAIGGTGSLLGVFRLERDVLAHRPDLVFLDFLCNDGTDEPNLEPTCAYEYILRTLIERGIPVEQMFFTFKFWAGKGFDPVKSLPRYSVYHRLAAAYGTPVGDVQRESLARDLAGGQTTLDAVWPIDGAHPDDLGYRYFFEAVRAGFERGVKDGAVCRVPAKPVYGTLADVKRTRLVDGSLPDGWRRSLTYRTSMWFDGLSSRWMGDVAAAKAGAAALTFTADCNFIGVFGEGDEQGLAFTLAEADKPVDTWSSSPGPGRLFIFRSRALDDWTQGARRRTFTLTPAADGKGELHLESIMTATLVPAAPGTARATATSGTDKLEALDHGRGITDKKD